MKASQGQKSSLLLSVQVEKSWGLPISWMTSVCGLCCIPALMADMANLSQHICRHSALLVATSSYSASVHGMPFLAIPDLSNLLLLHMEELWPGDSTTSTWVSVSVTELGTQVRFQLPSLEFAFPTTSAPIGSSVICVWL